MKDLANESLDYASSYLNSIESMFRKPVRRFDNDLLYNMIAICFEKFMIGWLAHYDSIANSHLPLMLYREIKAFEADAPESIKKLAILIGSFEGICSIEDFGYKTPTDEQVETIIVGLRELEYIVVDRLSK